MLDVSAACYASSVERTPLNAEQRAAVDHGDGPLMVLAGAGTGKTRVLVHRIARLVESGVEPWAILAVTFTNKAAGEMRHRLRELLGEAADAMWIGTFHATCARLLRRYGEKVGLTKSFVIFDDSDQLKLVEKLLSPSDPTHDVPHDDDHRPGTHDVVGEGPVVAPDPPA